MIRKLHGTTLTHLWCGCVLLCVWFGCEDYGLDGCVNGSEYGGEDSSEVVGVDGGCVGLGVCIGHGGCVGVHVIV